MNHVKETFLNYITYGMSGVGILVNFENVKSVILFVGAFILLSLQIYLHIIKIKNEKNVKDKPDNK